MPVPGVEVTSQGEASEGGIERLRERKWEGGKEGEVDERER